jgi:hypothetical protein
MRPSGWWELSEDGGATRVHLVMAPEPGGLFKLLAPLMRRSMSKGNERGLQELKARLEGGSSEPGAPGPG